MKTKSVELFKLRQKEYIKYLESFEKEKFTLENWTRKEREGSYGGGGLSSSINGKILEKAGVNFSEVKGTLNPTMTNILINQNKESLFFATGVSLVIHPFSPYIPTTHANFRFLEVENFKWFGGGIDLTPYHYDPELFTLFHQSLKQVCDKYKVSFYSDFKNKCDKYFYLKYRKEHRGIGGLFFDYLGKNEDSLDLYYDFISELSQDWSSIYGIFLDKYLNKEINEIDKKFQLHRRSRYVEFNLLHDRGTKFGLETGGRIESIMMSMPPLASWIEKYPYQNNENHSNLMKIIQKSKQWV